MPLFVGCLQTKYYKLNIFYSNYVAPNGISNLKSLYLVFFLIFVPNGNYSLLPTGINYGFQAMESHESPNVPFTVFRTRFLKGEIHIFI